MTQAREMAETRGYDPQALAGPFGLATRRRIPPACHLQMVIQARLELASSRLGNGRAIQ